ncbi:unnamed protein product [Darwinula stevensoni]|uniref:Uncharacterized protein n=1 Tax=Darwinula stevensoni TaxID=69355 RepID=A0A7R8X465_9CRUS|nr:unnamed protein product [Darwinula stevensoni]CAG0883123.1 unnamed protein product [Darwinula stevensoni]
MQALIPFSRLTYCSYLLSLNIQIIYQSSRKHVGYLDHPTMVYWFLGILAITEMGAFVFSLLFESPFLGLEKVIFPLLDEWIVTPIAQALPFEFGPRETLPPVKEELKEEVNEKIAIITEDVLKSEGMEFQPEKVHPTTIL